jgi:hypothetical protein
MLDIIEKKQKMHPRGIRVTDSLWALVESDAEKHETTPSTVVRSIVKEYYRPKPRMMKS